MGRDNSGKVKVVGSFTIVKKGAFSDLYEQYKGDTDSEIQNIAVQPSPYETKTVSAMKVKGKFSHALYLGGDGSSMGVVDPAEFTYAVVWIKANGVLALAMCGVDANISGFESQDRMYFEVTSHVLQSQ